MARDGSEIDKYKTPIRHDFDGVAPIDFQEVIKARSDSFLSKDAKDLVLKLYDDLAIQVRRLKLRYTNASFNLLICLKEEHDKRSRIERRDDTSAYIHEIAQASYLLWLYDHTETISSWLGNRMNGSKELHPNLQVKKDVADTRIENRLVMTPKELDISMAIAANHDSMEDLDLTPKRLKKALMKVPKVDEACVDNIVESIVALSKLDTDSQDAWMKRAMQSDVSLLGKLIDRQHNLATIIGSDRGEQKVKDYIQDTERFLDIAAPNIRKNGTLTYVGQYLYDQVDLIKLYHEVKHDETKKEDLRKSFKELVERYTVSSIHPEIHPMLCIAKRIVADEEFSDLANTLSRPDTIHYLARLGRRLVGPWLPKPRS